MTMKIRIIIFVALLIGATMTKLNAEIKKVAQSGYQFLKIDADARAAAMGVHSFLLVQVRAPCFIIRQE